MNVASLLEALQDIADDRSCGDCAYCLDARPHLCQKLKDLEIRIAIQPTWPLRLGLKFATLSSELEQENEHGDNEDFLWLVASTGAPYNENPYAYKELWETDG